MRTFTKALAGVLLAAVAEAKLRARAQEAADQAVLQTFAGAVSYDDLVTISRNGAGEIESIAADTPTINRLARLAAQRMQSILSAACEEGIAIPLGAFTGIGAWAGFGPDVTMKIVSASAVTGAASPNPANRQIMPCTSFSGVSPSYTGITSYFTLCVLSTSSPFLNVTV